MSPKDLSIGDWVRYKDDYPDVSLRGQYAIVKGLDGRVVTSKSKSGQSEHPDWLEPVPLTEAILKANGFENEDECNAKGIVPPLRYTLSDFGYLSVSISKEGDADSEARYHFPFKGVILDAKVINVHELQRALRVCGYYDLADIFKLE